jgi:penicillin-binding protein 1A
MQVQRILTTLASLAFTGLLAFGVFYIYFAARLPDVEGLKHADLQVPMQVYSKDGLLMAEFGSKHRQPVPLSRIPKQLIQAVLATEDKNFFQHGGVDFVGLIRAARSYIITGKKKQGASTITMQVARNFFLSRKKTFKRKIEEILLAIKIDQNLPKETILELYLNKIFFGEGAYGVQAAAKVYYGKSVAQLSLPQLAMIAGLPQAPSRNALINPGYAKNRRNHVLARMLNRGYLDQQTYEEAIKAPIMAARHRVKVSLHAPYVAEMVRRKMIRIYGKDAYTQGFRVYTTINSKNQKAANSALVRGLLAYDKRHGYRLANKNLKVRLGDATDKWQSYLQTLPVIHGLEPVAVTEVAADGVQILRANGSRPLIESSALKFVATDRNERFVPSNYFNEGDVLVAQQDQLGNWLLQQYPEIEGSIVSLDPAQGEIKSLVGGFSYKLSHFNRVTQAMRQPGSVFKPFVYTAALAKGFTFASIINDAPVIKQDSGEDSVWRPNNASKIFYGPTRLRIGLINSRNIVSVRLLEKVGIRYVRDFIARFGFNMDKQPKSLSLALGSGVVSPLEVAKGYATFANGGYGVHPYLVDHIENQRGQLITQGPWYYLDSGPKDAEEGRLLAPDLAYLMHTALQDVVRFGTARKLKVMGRADLAGKTGTTNKQLDTWFAGYTPECVTVVWSGFDQIRSTGEYGSQLALPIWRDYMSQVLAGHEEQQLPAPPGLVRAKIDSKTGLLATGDALHTVYEWFRKEFVPNPAKEATTAIRHHDENPMLAEDLF